MVDVGKAISDLLSTAAKDIPCAVLLAVVVLLILRRVFNMPGVGSGKNGGPPQGPSKM